MKGLYGHRKAIPPVFFFLRCHYQSHGIQRDHLELHAAIGANHDFVLHGASIQLDLGCAFGTRATIKITSFLKESQTITGATLGDRALTADCNTQAELRLPTVQSPYPGLPEHDEWVPARGHPQSPRGQHPLEAPPWHQHFFFMRPCA